VAHEKKGRTVAIVGAGALASFLAPALRAAGYRVTEIIAREPAKSMRRARALARKVGAKVATVAKASLGADLLWLCVPDRAIRAAAKGLAARVSVLSSEKASRRASGLEKHEADGIRCAFHSSGALGSSELDALRAAGIAVASVHPLMTFVDGARPSLAEVPFALEGDGAAMRMARRIVGDLGGEAFALPAGRKRAYHAWATMTSPLLVAYLVALEEAARGAGLSRERARRMSLPIIRQTLANYARRGPAKSFSGPLIRGDVETVAKHLMLLRASPMTREVYVALAKVALEKLPVKNRAALRRLLKN
jgi:predicted short-subunit dehydrogenase-like oxidoreductase (DUF2520 family)